MSRTLVFTISQLLTFAAMFCCVVADVHGDAIGINFIGGPHSGGPDGPWIEGTDRFDNPIVNLLDGEVLGPNETDLNWTPGTDYSLLMNRAGVVAQANWNNLAPWSETANSSNGTPRADSSKTGLTSDEGTYFSNTKIAWEADNSWYSRNGSTVDASGNPWPAIDDGDEALMQGYIDVSSSDADVTVQLTNLPFPKYDVYVYIGSSGIQSDGRISRVRLYDYESPATMPNLSDALFYNTDGNDIPADEDDLLTDTYVLSNTGSGFFESRSDYLRATATSEFEAMNRPSNYVKFENQTSSDIQIQLYRDPTYGNMGLAGIQIVEAKNLDLVIDRNSGYAEIRNPNDIPIDIDFYQILSESGGINLDAMLTLEEQDYEGNGASGTGNGWEVLGDSTSSKVSEGYLNGSTQIAPGEAISLGYLYNGNGTEDIRLRYNDLNSDVKNIAAVYTDLFIAGDFNQDGLVNLADYTVWRDTLGSTTDLRANGDDTGASQGVVDMSDYQIWKTNFGMQAGLSSAESQSVPEPHSVSLMALLVATAMAGQRLHTSRT
ncbi:hypothetical protein [Aeoliella mucimassa]|uniref:Dockerin domain-containing protein n=1 Tax=Aeoliella mucimassa TaxID=2527972 RepID=A0A518AVF0_9BACT|nr:hypothetical protein [Aeoliella mucimassa]QDU58691.1 hypothetical protein Pan181_49310 [Aeoliella mucimassa]